MKKQKIKLNIIKPQASPCKEDMHKVAEFFDLLLTWHLEEQRALNEKKISIEKKQKTSQYF